MGAQRGDVLRLVLGDGAKMALVGVGVGVVGALGLTRLMASVLHGVSATDPVTFAAVAAILTVGALAACYIPARRATSRRCCVAVCNPVKIPGLHKGFDSQTLRYVNPGDPVWR